MKGYSMVHGVEVSDKQKKEMTDLTKEALKKYSKNGFAVVDANTCDAKTLNQIRDICGCVGFTIVEDNSWLVFFCEQTEIVSP